MKRRSKQILPLLAILLVLVAFALRLYRLDTFSFWQDEPLTALRAGYTIPSILSNRIVIQEAVSTDTHPPLYFLLINVSRRLLGESDFAYRYPSLLAGVLLVPLLYQFGRRLQGGWVGLLAAFLATINPLQIWYAQEARMYTLLLLLTTVATYALWRALTSGTLRKWFLLYLLFAALSFLTHYTAVFLVAGQSVLWAWLLWRRGQRKLLLVGGGIAALLAIPFIPFTVPRLFAGAEANYTYVSPLIMLQDVVHGFGMGLTVDFERLSIKLLDAGVALLLVAGVLAPWRKGGRRTRIFLLIYLLAVVVGLALGSLIKPMYQGARHIFIGSSAFFLLLARGVLVLPRRSAALLGLALLVAGPLISLNNLYNDPGYARDDLRTLVETIEERAGEDDVVVYNNAVLMPVHEHYGQRSDLAVTALPVYPHQAGEETEIRLAQLAEQYERLWFVTDPPADGRDAERVVSRWLAQNLLLVERFRTHSRTGTVALEAYATPPWQLEALPPQAQAVGVEWPGLPALRGWRPDFEEPAASPTLWFDLFWEGGSYSLENVHLRLSLRDRSGNVWVDHNQPFWASDTSPFFEAPLVRLAYGVSLPVGMPPGEYELQVSPWNSASGEAVGEQQSLGTVRLAASSEWPLPAQTPFEAQFPLQFSNGLQLTGVGETVANIRPGNTLPLTLYWQAQAPLGGQAMSYELEVVGPSGQVWITRSGAPGPDWLGPGEWPVGAPIREVVGLAFPPEAPPGNYRLRWRLQSGDAIVRARPAWRPWRGEWVRFGHVRVDPWPLNRALPDAEQVLEASFGPSIQLYGFDLAARELRPGEALDLTLYWRAQDVPEGHYLVFVHVIGPQGTIVAQADRIPDNWRRPTRGWRAGEVLSDSYELFLPPDAPAGDYRLFAGLFEAESEQRLPVEYEGRLQPDGRLLLATVTVR